MLRLTYFGQSCFLLQNESFGLLFDPYFSGKTAAMLPAGTPVSYILVSHAHQDHLGEALPLAKKYGAPVISTAEICNYLKQQGCPYIEPMHIGGKALFPFGQVKLTAAQHGGGSIPGAIACGFLVFMDGCTLYFAGDTGLFGDMKLIGERSSVDYALLPIGDRYTMGPEDAAFAASLLQAKNVVPMHYNGNERTKQDPNRFANEVKQCCDSHVIILSAGEETVLKAAQTENGSI